MNTIGHLFEIDHIDEGFFRAWVTDSTGDCRYFVEIDRKGASLMDAMEEITRRIEEKKDE
jgi:hypothetical protein